MIYWLQEDLSFIFRNHTLEARFEGISLQSLSLDDGNRWFSDLTNLISKIQAK